MHTCVLVVSLACKSAICRPLPLMLYPAMKINKCSGYLPTDWQIYIDWKSEKMIYRDIFSTVEGKPVLASKSMAN